MTLLRSVDLDAVASVGVAEIEEALGVVRRLESATAACQARLLGRLSDDRELRRRTGATDTTAWLRDRTGVSGRQARKATALAEGLAGMESTGKALDAGELTVENAEILARAAGRGRLGDSVATEEALLDAARRLSPEQLSREVRRREQEADDQALLEDEQLAHRRRSLTTRWLRDGSVEGRFRLPPSEANPLRAKLSAFSSPDPKDCPPELRRTPEQRRADALIDLLHATTKPSPTVGGERARASVLVPYQLLADADSRLPGETEFAGPLSAEACRRLLCDGSIVRIVVSSTGSVLDVGRETAKWPVAQRRAIVAMDGGCRFPGCTREAGLCNVHHVRFYENGGRTAVDNGVLLCVRHHHLVHEGGWTLTMEPSTRLVTVVSPDRRIELTSVATGPAVTMHGRQTRAGAAGALAETAEIAASAETVQTAESGEMAETAAASGVSTSGTGADLGEPVRAVEGRASPRPPPGTSRSGGEQPRLDVIGREMPAHGRGRSP